VKNAKKFMNLLAKDHEFIRALETPAGEIILTMLNERVEAKMAEIVNMKSPSCTDCSLLRAKIEIEQIMSLVSHVKNRINSYNERHTEFQSM